MPTERMGPPPGVSPPMRMTASWSGSNVSARRVGRLCGSAGGVERLPVPGQEFGDTSGRMIGDTGEHVGDIVVRVETVELCGLDQRVDRSGAAAAGIGAGKQVILAANGDTAESA